MKKLLSLVAAAALPSLPAAAQEGLESIGKPQPGGLNFQPAVTELMEDIVWLDTMLLVVITVISVFVCALLLICIVRFNRKANPEPSSFTHNSPLEVAWTLGPILILVFIGSFSLPVLFKQQEIPEAD
ncbi:MAG: cytochrome c oxidase subunit II transmembrane domain-containing protein, partial [Pseudomonadota bacterium]